MLIIFPEEWLQHSVKLLAQRYEPLDSPLDQVFQTPLQVNLSHEPMQKLDSKSHSNVGTGSFVLRACLYAGQEAKQRLDSLLDLLLPFLPAQESISFGTTDQCLSMIEVATDSTLRAYFAIWLIHFSVAAVASLHHSHSWLIPGCPRSNLRSGTVVSLPILLLVSST